MVYTVRVTPSTLFSPLVFACRAPSLPTYSVPVPNQLEQKKKIIVLTGLTLELWPQVSSGFSALSSHSLHFSSHLSLLLFQMMPFPSSIFLPSPSQQMTLVFISE